MAATKAEMRAALERIAGLTVVDGAVGSEAVGFAKAALGIKEKCSWCGKVHVVTVGYCPNCSTD